MKKEDKILITGGRGMVGKNLILKLRNLGFENLIFPSMKELDLRNREEVFQFFNQEKIDYVFHLAAKVGGIKSNMNNPVEYLRDNLLLNTNIIDACYKFKIKKLINLGSSCIYPKNCLQPMKEEDLLSGKLEPTNEGYALSKICSLKLCKYYNEQYGTNFISLMPPNMYGEYEKFDEEHSHVLAALLKRFHEAKINGDNYISVWGTGDVKREFLYVGDMVEGLIFSMDKLKVENLVNNCFLNCGSGEEISIKELAFKIKEIVGFEGEIKFDVNKPEGMVRKLLDSSRFNFLSFRHEINLEEGIKKTYEYFKKEF